MERYQLFPYRRLLLMVVLLTLAGQTLMSRLMVTTSSSLNHRIFWLQTTGRTPTGSYQLFRFIDERGERLVTKRVACGAGDQLDLSPEGMLRCDGRELAKLRPGDRPAASVTGRIPPGYLFMLGDHPNSIDSRRFGLVDCQLVVRQAYPIW